MIGKEFDKSPSWSSRFCTAHGFIAPTEWPTAGIDVGGYRARCTWLAGPLWSASSSQHSSPWAARYLVSISS